MSTKSFTPQEELEKVARQLLTAFSSKWRSKFYNFAISLVTVLFIWVGIDLCANAEGVGTLSTFSLISIPTTLVVGCIIIGCLARKLEKVNVLGTFTDEERQEFTADLDQMKPPSYQRVRQLFPQLWKVKQLTP